MKLIRGRTRQIVSILVTPLSVLLIVAAFSVRESGANHAYLYSDGIGFQDVQGGAWIDVCIHDVGGSTMENTAIAAIDSWRNWRIQPNRYWLRHTANCTEAEADVEIMGKDAASIFTGEYDEQHELRCQQLTLYARAVITDESDPANPDWRTLINGLFETNPGYPFKRASVCLNLAQPNDMGTIAHELGHVLGLSHVTTDTSSCPDTGLNSIMAYNYSNRAAQYPDKPELNPTAADVFGRWVCGTTNPGGLAHIYQIPPDEGLPSSINTDADPFQCNNREETGNDPQLGGQRQSDVLLGFLRRDL